MLEDLSVYLVYLVLTFYSFVADCQLDFPVLCNHFTFTGSEQKKNKFCDSPQTIQGFSNKENLDGITYLKRSLAREILI
jgi:hypothetical protein